MEYILGSFVTIFSIFFANKFLKKYVAKERLPAIKYSQTHIFNMIKPILNYEPMTLSPSEAQSYKYLESLYIKVMIVGNEAYWIKDNALYTASLVEGEVDKNTTQKVDTMAMDKVQLEKTMFIVEKLREDRKDDSGSTGKSKL